MHEKKKSHNSVNSGGKVDGGTTVSSQSNKLSLMMSQQFRRQEHDDHSHGLTSHKDHEV